MRNHHNVTARPLGRTYPQWSFNLKRLILIALCNYCIVCFEHQYNTVSNSYLVSLSLRTWLWIIFHFIGLPAITFCIDIALIFALCLFLFFFLFFLSFCLSFFLSFFLFFIIAFDTCKLITITLFYFSILIVCISVTNEVRKTKTTKKGDFKQCLNAENHLISFAFYNGNDWYQEFCHHLLLLRENYFKTQYNQIPRTSLISSFSHMYKFIYLKKQMKKITAGFAKMSCRRELNLNITVMCE